MTNSEAIETLRANYPDPCYGSLREAVDTAIYALSAKPDVPDINVGNTELKQEFLRMASYIDVLLECSDEQKETLIGFISRIAEHMPWTERD